jgi:hypothetical protein
VQSSLLHQCLSPCALLSLEDELFQKSVQLDVQFRNADISLCVNKWSCTCTFHCRSLSDWLRFLISFLYICTKYKLSLHGSKTNTNRKCRKTHVVTEN